MSLPVIPNFSPDLLDWKIDTKMYPLNNDKPVVIKKSDWEIEKEKQEARFYELQIKVLEEQLKIAKGVQTPQYDISSGILSFMGKSIQIPLNTNLEMVCRIVLKNITNMTKRWSWDEIVEEAREDTANFKSTQIYSAARSINDKVAQETAIKDFFITKPTSTIRLSPQFVPK